MTVEIITPEKGDELRRLYAEYTAATNKALEALQLQGMNSRSFLDADREAGILNARIRDILGVAGQHWTS